MDPRLRKKIIILSILLHVLLFLVWEGGKRLNLLRDDPKTKEEESAPIVFDLQEPQRPNRVIETPDDAKVVEKQKKADFLSDKNAVARNKETDPNLKVGDAYSRGVFESHELPQNQGPQGTPTPPPQPELKAQEEQQKSEKTEQQPKQMEINPNRMIEESLDRYHRQYRLQPIAPQKPGMQQQLPSVNHDNQASRAEDMGGISFNTYNWNWAPYMLALKRIIGRNIFPPQAFTHLGLIDGETLLRFKIYPNGQLRDLQVIQYRGHKSLMETSYNAVSISAPFPELPSDFPEPYLEVTGKFNYLVHRGPHPDQRPQ